MQDPTHTPTSSSNRTLKKSSGNLRIAFAANPLIALFPLLMMCSVLVAIYSQPAVEIREVPESVGANSRLGGLGSRLKPLELGPVSLFHPLLFAERIEFSAPSSTDADASAMSLASLDSVDADAGPPVLIEGEAEFVARPGDRGAVFDLDAEIESPSPSETDEANQTLAQAYL